MVISELRNRSYPGLRLPDNGLIFAGEFTPAATWSGAEHTAPRQHSAINQGEIRLCFREGCSDSRPTIDQPPRRTVSRSPFLPFHSIRSRCRDDYLCPTTGTLQTSIHEHAAYILRPLASVSLSLLPSIILPFPLWSTRVFWTLLLSLCIGTNEKHMHANCRATLHYSPLSPRSFSAFWMPNDTDFTTSNSPFYFTDAFPKFLLDRSFPVDDHLGPLFSCPSAKSFMQNAIDGFSIHWGIRSSR